jgi:hypothetical protein
MAYIGQNPIDAFRGLASYDTFTGDGSTTTFDLTKVAPDGGQNDILVVVNNVIQEPGVSKSYTLGVDGNGEYKRVTFNTAPESADEIYIINPGRTTALNTVSDNAITSSKLNTSAITGQTELAEVAADGDFFLLYDTSVGTLKKIQKQYIAATLTYSKGTFTGDGSTTTFTITAGRAVDNILVFVNGICLVPTDDYTISSTTLTFATAPTSSAEITVRYLPI